ncbi:hypothetical protein CR513_55618, partial [Mucuna pruriens]
MFNLISHYSLYTPLLIPISPWIDISVDFILGLPRFSKMVHFIPCHKSDDVSHVTNIFFRDMVRLHGTLNFLEIFGGPYGVGLAQSYPSRPLVILKRMDKPRCFFKKSLRIWIPHVAFSYNKVFNSTTSYSPFELTYGFNPFSPLDLFPLPKMPNCVNDEWLSKAQFVLRLHHKAWLHMEKKVENYAKNANKGRKEVFFKERDLVWMHLRKEQFPHLRKSKLLPRGVGPFKIIKKINDNA